MLEARGAGLAESLHQLAEILTRRGIVDDFRLISLTGCSQHCI